MGQVAWRAGGTIIIASARGLRANVSVNELGGFLS